MQTSTWTKPQIYPKIDPKRKKSESFYMSKEWRVWFRFLHGAKRIVISRKANLNHIPNFTERIKQANALKEILIDRLREGWNPIDNSYPAKTSTEIEMDLLQNMSFHDAIDFAYEKKKKDWKYKTSQDYESVKKYLKQAAGKMGLHKKITEFKKIDFKQLLEFTIEMRELGEKGYNKYREYLSSLVSELVEWDILEYNVIRDIKTKSVPKKIAHRPPTQDQRVRIIDHIKSRYRPYYRFLSILYGCAIRPKEITNIKIKHLHKMEGVFRLPSEITKSNQESDVPIPNWVVDLLSEMKLHTLNPEWYIFSTRNKYGSFMPGPNKMHSNTTTAWWRRIVKTDLALDVNQYSLKKLSGDDLVKLQRREGADNLLGLAQFQMRHASQKQTSVYTHQDEAIMKEIIQEKMPEL